MPRMRIGAAEQIGASPKSPAQSRTSGSSAVGTPNRSQQLGIPCAAADVHQQRARRIGGVGDVRLAAGQPPEQEAVDRAEGEPAGPRRLARARHMVEQPGDLGGREIGIEQQPGARCDHGLVPRLPQRGAGVSRAPILPDDGIVDRLAGRAVPDDRGLALIGDADRGDVSRGDAGLRHRRAHGRDASSTRSPRGSCSTQPGRGIDLRKFLLRDRDRRQRGIEQDGTRRGRALIDGKEVVRQARPLSAFSKSGNRFCARNALYFSSWRAFRAANQYPLSLKARSRPGSRLSAAHCRNIIQADLWSTPLAIFGFAATLDLQVSVSGP